MRRCADATRILKMLTRSPRHPGVIVLPAPTASQPSGKKRKIFMCGPSHLPISILKIARSMAKKSPTVEDNVCGSQSRASTSFTSCNWDMLHDPQIWELKYVNGEWREAKLARVTYVGY